MDNQNEIIELKFEGNGIKPSKVKASEVAELIKHFEASLLSVIKQNHPELNDDFVLLSFQEIKDESLGLRFLPHLFKQYILPAYITITTSISSKSFNTLPNNSIEELRSITRFAKKYNCDGAFIYNGERLATVHPDTDISFNQNDIIKGETIVYAEVLKAGGVKPRATIKINDSYTVSFDTSKAIAKRLANSLYAIVGLKGVAIWDKNTYKVLDFRPTDVLDYNETDTPLKDTFKELGSLFGDYLKDKGDYKNYIN